MALTLYKAHFKINTCRKIHKAGSGLCSRFISNRSPKSSSLLLLEGYCRSPSLFDLQFNAQKGFRYTHISSALFGKVVPYKLSDIGEGIVEVVVKEWHIKPGDSISQFDPICEVQSDKASVTISSRFDGVVRKLHYQIDDTAKVGEALIDIEIDDDTSHKESIPNAVSEGDKPRTTDTKPQTVNTEDSYSQDKALATPAVRRLAKENNINLNEIKGSGSMGRILKDDIIFYLEKLKGVKTEESPTVPPPMKSPLPDQEVVQKITGIRKAMVKSMISAWEIPHFSFCDEVNALELTKLRDELKRIGDSKGFKITYLPFLIKAASLALLKYPILNSHVDDGCENIIVKSFHNIGVAIDSPNGLVVPNIKNVQDLNVLEVARELNRLQDLAAKGQLGLDDLNNGTFTLSNIGNIGGTYMKPIIFPPQVIIGAIGKIQVLPRFDGSKNVIESHIFNISWSADHRVIDGATVARFSGLWKLYIESPKLLLNL